MFHTAVISLIWPVNTISNRMFCLARSATQKFYFFGKVIANKKIPTIFAKEGDITKQHYNAWNSDISLLHAPHELGDGNV